MGTKHIAEVLIEANKKISNVINKMEREENSQVDIQTSIDDLNGIIRSLDHLVEDLEKKIS